MPAKGKKKAVPQATKPERGPRTAKQQYDTEYRIWTDISNAMYEASARVAEWIKEGGGKHDKRIWAAVAGIKAYTTAYVTAEKERVKGTEMEELRGNRAYEMLTTQEQQLSEDLGMTNAPQPSTHAEAAAQTDEALDETTKSLRERIATMERDAERTTLEVTELVKKMAAVGEVLEQELAAHETTRKNLATMNRGYKARVESMETMKREHEAEVEVLKGRVKTSHHIYTESAAQTEEELDKTTALPKDDSWALNKITALPEEIPTREKGGTTQTDDSWALDNITTLPEEIPTRKEEGRKSYAQATSQGIPITIAPPQLMPAAHTVTLDDWKPYEDLSGYEKEDSGYESGCLG